VARGIGDERGAIVHASDDRLSGKVLVDLISWLVGILSLPRVSKRQLSSAWLLGYLSLRMVLYYGWPEDHRGWQD